MNQLVSIAKHPWALFKAGVKHFTLKVVSAPSSELKQQRPKEVLPWGIDSVSPPALKYIPVCRSRSSPESEAS